MTDPLSITTALLTLGAAVGQTLTQLQTLRESFADAPGIIADIENDCRITKSVLEATMERLGPDSLPTLQIEDGDNDSAKGVNMEEILRGNVAQLQLDIDALLSELTRFNTSHQSKIGRLIHRGRMAWEVPYLTAMHNKILAKLRQFELVESNLQSRMISNIERQTSRSNSLISSVSTIFDAFFLGTRRSSGTPSSLSANSRGAPNYNARAQLVEAINEGKKRDVETLLQQVDPNFYTDGLKELYPLHIAAEKGDLDIIGLLLYYKAKVDCYTQGGERRTPLMMALAMNHPVAAISLIFRGANASHKDSEGQTALHIAARRNLYAATQVLLSNGADPNAYDTSGRTPLMEAVSRDDREIQPFDTNILRILLEYKADPTLGTLKNHITPLHHAACKGYTEDLHILAKSAQSRVKWVCSVQDSSGRSPLWFAARYEHFEAVNILLGLGADVNHRSQDAEFPTPLWAMASTRRLDAVSALLEAGADPNVRNAEGHTLLHMACWSGDERLTQLLLKHNAIPSIRDNDDMEPMHHAAEKGNEATIRPLLECRTHKVNVDCVDGSGTTPLIHAAENGHLRLLRYLVDQGADWKHRDNFGCDAFYIACAKGHILCATYLLGRGAEINMPNSKGNTPLHVAARMGHIETVRWLLYLGADTTARSIAPSDGMDKVGTPAEVARVADLDHDLAEFIASMIEEFVTDDNKPIAWKVEMTDPEET